MRECSHEIVDFHRLGHENRKIVHWRDYMDSLAAWTALNVRR
jgi:limonene-1,2-epoxide hydrolase